MSTKEKHLFVVEGRIDEPWYLDMLDRNFFNERVSIKCVYDAEIYQLYKQMKADDFELDIVTLLKERNAENKALLQDLTNEDFSSIYLFFDYDAHSTMADDAKIAEMLQYFCNDTENGMLFISYPMVEALRHYHDREGFKTLCVKCKRGTNFENTNCPYKNDCETLEECYNEPHYKKLYKTQCLPELLRSNINNVCLWKEVISSNIYKANYLVNDIYEMPSDLISQESIYQQQLIKHINHKCPQVAVLSAFPMYVLEYYGTERIKNIIHQP